MSAVRVEGVSVNRGGTSVLSGVDFVASAGSVLCLTGANGSGKTTVLRALAGLVRPSSGRILVWSEPVDERDPGFRRRLAALVGSVPFSLTMTSREHLTAVAASWGPGVRAAETVADEVLARLGMQDLAGRFPHELSSGQVQLLSLATVLARPFEVLVLDEPEQRLDDGRRDLLARVLREERERGAAIIVATHSRELLEALGATELRLGHSADGLGDGGRFVPMGNDGGRGRGRGRGCDGDGEGGPDPDGGGVGDHDPDGDRECEGDRDAHGGGDRDGDRDGHGGDEGGGHAVA